MLNQERERKIEREKEEREGEREKILSESKAEWGETQSWYSIRTQAKGKAPNRSQQKQIIFLCSFLSTRGSKATYFMSVF